MNFWKHFTKDKIMTNEELYREANAAGELAGNQVNVTPMVVGEATSIFGNDIDYTKETYVVNDGVCGFAWINIKPANSKFAKYLVAQGVARKNSYEGGISVWVSQYNQSLTRKESYARAFAKVLRDNDIRAYAGSRMD